jgi:hypothetical protein
MIFNDIYDISNLRTNGDRAHHRIPLTGNLLMTKNAHRIFQGYPKGYRRSFPWIILQILMMKMWKKMRKHCPFPSPSLQQLLRCLQNQKLYRNLHLRTRKISFPIVMVRKKNREKERKEISFHQCSI